MADVTPFLFDGLKAGEPGLVVASARNLAAVRQVLGSDGDDQLHFADSDTWGSGNVLSRVLAIRSSRQTAPTPISSSRGSTSPS